jgi:hypothetical protein
METMDQMPERRGTFRRWGWAWLGLGVSALAGVVFLATPACGCTTRAAAYGVAIKSDLKNLATQQEIHFGSHGTYSEDVAALGFELSDGVGMEVRANEHGWSARASHVMLDGERGCALLVGDPPEVLRTGGQQLPTGPDEMVCDDLEFR